MDEIVKFVMSKTGLSEEKARAAIIAMIDFLKMKLPPNLESQIESIITGGVTKDLSRSLDDLFK